VIELGTSAGISTLYLAKADSHVKVTTIDANTELQQITRNNFKELGIQNIRFIPGYFRDHLVPVLKESNGELLVFIDGNHSYSATLEYFNICCTYAKANTILVFDDINWSGDMRRAWQKIRTDFRVHLCINTFFMGIVFFNPEYPKGELMFKL
jgi:predicted O-methyltransferase YrrM